MKFGKCFTFAIAIFLFLAATLHVSSAGTSLSRTVRQPAHRNGQENHQGSLTPNQHRQIQSMNDICSQPKYEKITSAKSIISAIQIITEETQQEDQLQTTKKRHRCKIQDDPRLYQQIMTLDANVSELYGKVESYFIDTNNVLKKKMRTSASNAYGRATDYQQLLKEIRSELSECTKNRSINSYTQCNFLPSRRIYELFAQKNVISYNMIFDDSNIANFAKDFYVKLNEFLLVMFEMSNLCNERYLLQQKNPVYTCNIRIDIEGSNSIVKKILANGKRKGLADVSQYENKKYVKFMN